jgi:hypothetical protein
MRPLAVREMHLGRAHEAWVPNPEDDAGRKSGLPFWERGNNPVHQNENPLWLIVHFYVNVEFDMLVLWLLVDNVEKWVDAVCPLRSTNLHQQIKAPLKCWDGLLGLLDGPSMLHPVCSVPFPLAD